MRDGCYQLKEVIELDEGFFSTETEDSEKGKPLKRGQGSCDGEKYTCGWRTVSKLQTSKS